MNSKKCIICNSKNIEENKAIISGFLLERMFNNENKTVSLVRCKNCNFCFYSLRPTEENINAFYNGYRNEEYQLQRQKYEPDYTKQKNAFLLESKKERNSRKKNSLNILNKYIDVKKLKNILDFGGDKGQFIPEFPETTDKYVYEISGVTPISGVSEIKDFDALKEKKWDLIMCSHVLEHVISPNNLIKEIDELLEPGGYLYIEVPENCLFGLNRKIKIFKEFIKKTCKIKTYFNLYREFKYHLSFKIKLPDPPKIKIPKKNRVFCMTEHINIFDEKTFKQMLSGKNYKILCNTSCTVKNEMREIKVISCLAQKIK